MSGWLTSRQTHHPQWRDDVVACCPCPLLLVFQFLFMLILIDSVACSSIIRLPLPFLHVVIAVVCQTSFACLLTWCVNFALRRSIEMHSLLSHWFIRPVVSLLWQTLNMHNANIMKYYSQHCFRFMTEQYRVSTTIDQMHCTEHRQKGKCETRLQ